MERLDDAENVVKEQKPWQFKPGNSGGPGRPKREVEREYLNAIVGLCPLSTWGGIVEKAIQDALAGDKFARDWLSKYLIGEPKQVGDDGEISPAKQFSAALTDEQLDRCLAKLRDK